MASLPGLQYCDDACQPPMKKLKLEEGAENDAVDVDAEFDDDDFYSTPVPAGASHSIQPENTKRNYDSFLQDSHSPAVAPRPDFPGITTDSLPISPSLNPHSQLNQNGTIDGEDGGLGDDDMSDDFYGTKDIETVVPRCSYPDQGIAVADKTAEDTMAHQVGTEEASGTQPPTDLLEFGHARKTELAETVPEPGGVVEDAATQSTATKITDTQTIGHHDPEFKAAAEANNNNPDAEWRFDTSDAESTESSSDETSSEDSDDSDEESLPLDREAAAKQLLEALGDEDDNDPATTGPLKTANEIVDEIIPKPNITVTPEMQITELGRVERVVGNLVLINANTSGDYRVLEAGSAVCLADRTVIGAVMETMGKVQKPMYSVGFADANEIEQAGIAPDTKIFYVDAHSTFVFTHALKTKKGTDASNLYDEEAGVEEVEFSDDEKEAEYKRELKSRKRNPRQERTADQESSRASAGQRAHPDQTLPPKDTKPISYDEEDEGEEMYTPLRRPDNLHEMMTFREPIEDRSKRGRQFSRGSGRGGHGTQNVRGRGGRGGFRGSSRGDRFDRGQQRAGQQRGGANNRRNHSPSMNRHNSPQSRDRRFRSELNGTTHPPPQPDHETPNARSPPILPAVSSGYSSTPASHSEAAYGNTQAQTPVLNPLALLQLLPQLAQANPALVAQLPAMVAGQRGQHQQPSLPQSQPQPQPQHLQQAHSSPSAYPRWAQYPAQQHQYQYSAYGIPAPPPLPPPQPTHPPNSYQPPMATEPAHHTESAEAQARLAQILRNLTGGSQGPV